MSPEEVGLSRSQTSLAAKSKAVRNSSSGSSGIVNSKSKAAEEALQSSLLNKAKELEAELAHYKCVPLNLYCFPNLINFILYRSENANLRQLKRQEEGLVADLMQQKQEVYRIYHTLFLFLIRICL